MKSDIKKNLYFILLRKKILKSMSIFTFHPHLYTIYSINHFPRDKQPFLHPQLPSQLHNLACKATRQDDRPSSVFYHGSPQALPPIVSIGAEEGAREASRALSGVLLYIFIGECQDCGLGKRRCQEYSPTHLTSR